MKQKIAAMTAALAATFCVSADVVQYYDPTDPASPRKEANCTPITSTTTTLAPGWYVVDVDVTMTGRITVSGSGVHLILCDGATLNATNGVQRRGGSRRGESRHGVRGRERAGGGVDDAGRIRGGRVCEGQA